MDNFKKEFEKIKEVYYKENPFQKLIEKREIFAQNPLILYGCGILCRTVISVCNDVGIKVTAVCDTYKTGVYRDTGFEIFSPERMKEEYPDGNIIICSYRYADEIKRNLISLGYGESKIYQSTFSMVRFIHPEDFIRDYLEGYEWAYNFFTDIVSKKLVIDSIKMYLIGSELKKTSEFLSYCIPEMISFGANEVFVDGGAYCGETAEGFIRHTKAAGGYRHIYSFEPDDTARERALRNLAGYKNIDLIGKGLWSSDTELEFFSDGGNAGSSFTAGNSSVKVPVTSLDSFFADKPDEELPTFIKMDIEGSEKEALIGAKEVIRRKHPKLAICVYHKPEDIYELPKLIYGIDPGYRFALRQLVDGVFDTVLYAI
jgi:FkbM family methyltransferase